MNTTTVRSTHRRRADRTGGAAGNERLTALTGTVLLLVLAAEGTTILSLHGLLTVHFFLGMLLVGPVALKICSTCYRFARYYAGAPAYRRKGPPAPLLRALGPLVLLSSVAVIGTGVMLAVVGPGPGRWLLLHKASFLCWVGLMTIHVLAYAPRLPRLLSAEARGGRDARGGRFVLAGRGSRLLLLVAALLAGLVLAALTMHLAVPWEHGRRQG